MREEKVMEESLEELERKYFMLQMADHWDNSDFEYERELRRKIKEKKEECKGKDTTK